MIRRAARMGVVLLLVLVVTACGVGPTEDQPRAASPLENSATMATAEPEATATRFTIVTPVVVNDPPIEGASGDPPPAEIVATAKAIFGEGGIYVASLPRPGDVPPGWLMDRAPRFDSRIPQPGATYRFACEELPARSNGVASVGYRSLEGLPSITIEYVVYPNEADATAALADMRRATSECADFGVAVAGGVEARMMPIPYPRFGSDSFAAELQTRSAATGDLLTHVIKIQQDNVVIGINHAVLAGGDQPDSDVSETLSGLAVRYVSQMK